MDIIVYSDKKTWIHRVDPRARIIAACALSLALSMSLNTTTLLAGVGMGLLAVAIARVPLPALLQRLVPLNALLSFLCAVLLFFTPGEMLFQVGQVEASREGLHQAIVIGLKANGILLVLAALLGTIEMVDLGHALGRLRVPRKLTHLLLFTVRYMGLMLSEYERLSRAARVRGFVPGLNRHTLKTTGYMLGMILVRSYDRGERILNAMRLRGYQGAVTFRGEFAFGYIDAAFAIVTTTALALLIGLGRG